MSFYFDKYLNQILVALLILFGVHKGAFFQLLISFIIFEIPSLKDIVGFHLSFLLIFCIFAFDTLGSPGLSGILICLPPISFAKVFTVCGYAPRLRLDLSVNILTNFAVNKSFIKVFGGDQLRPNLHIHDYFRAVETLINASDEKIENQIFNVGFQNLSISDLAQKVKKVVEKEFPEKKNIQIVKSPSDDKRSYHINSDKIKKILGFEPKKTIENAIEDLCKAFKANKINNSFENDLYFNVKRLQNIQAK